MVAKLNIPNKRGSSRRKGDEYQDFSALHIILQSYLEGEDFEAYLEYEKVQSIDDIVVFSGKTIRGIQIKYAINNLDVYVLEDFTDEKSPVYFGKYAKGWKRANVDHPEFEVLVELFSNRSRDSKLERIINADGKFTSEFIDGKLRKAPKGFRDQLKIACGFEEPDADKTFQEFLKAFSFQLGQRRLDDLKGYLEGEVLDHHLGISDRTVILELKKLIEKHAIELHEPITRSHLDEIFREAQGRFLLPQVFPVDTAHFVEVKKFGDTLREKIHKASSGYIVVTGLPGSGKSTLLSEFFDGIETDNRFAVCRYYCFVSPDDDHGRLRLQAESLRVNVLSELHRTFDDYLDREFDYSEHRFVEALKTLGQVVSDQGIKLLILLDGLDHAERDRQVRETVLRALPTALPTGIIIIVGTQELKHWEPLALREGRQDNHVPVPQFTTDETRTFLVEKHELSIDESWVQEIQRKSQGLPLYLRYVATWLHEHQGNEETLEFMPEAVDGDIRKYYERLWANFERDGMSYGRYLCGVLAGLRFPVRADELAEFQSQVSRVEMDSAFRSLTHLFRVEEDGVSIFHDSFRVFVNNKLDESTRHTIAREILRKLKNEPGSPRWFTYVFRYALEASDTDYLLSEVNRPFVDYALQHCRPKIDIMAAIETATKAAAGSQDLVSLARLGSLHFRTHERLEQFNYDSLAKVQLSLGRVGEVLGFCCRPQDNRWLVDQSVAEQVMIWCADANQRELGEKLFKIFVETHDCAPSASVLGIYARRTANALKWLSHFKPRRDIMERIDRFLPGYSPPLEDFLTSRFHHGPHDDWKRFKRIRRLFPNHLIRHIFLRLVARYRSKAELTSELEDYIANTPTAVNLEVAGYAAFSGLSVEQVRELAGPIILPPRHPPQDCTHEEIEGHFDHFEWSAVVLGYENDPIQIGNVVTHLGKVKTMYAGFLRFLLQAGLCIGRASTGAFLQDNEGYLAACLALDELQEAGKEDQVDEMETLRACRPMLPELLFRLTDYVATNYVEKLDVWRDRLLALRDSEMWVSHWGISEITEDYIFELNIWERVLAVVGMGSRLRPILLSCSKTFEEVTALKSGSRSEHFLRLASIAASSGWRKEAEQWRDKGTACSLTYGYRKDSTIDNLVDVLELLNIHEPDHGLSRSAAILELIKWMQVATDNSGTKHFEQSVFRVVLQSSREAAFQLIRFFKDHIGRWKMLDCLEQYCLTVDVGDPHVLWVLKDAFTPHFHEAGRHSKQVAVVAEALRDFAQKKESQNVDAWQIHYNMFIQMNLDPSWWPDNIWMEVQKTESRTRPRICDSYSPTTLSSEKDYTLNGKLTPRAQLEKLLSESLDSFSKTMEQLRAENSYFHDREIIANALERHAGHATSSQSILLVWDVAQATGDDVGVKALHTIAQRLFDLGESEDGFECLLFAYQQCSKYHYGSNQGQAYLVELCQRDCEKVISFLVERCEQALRVEYGGFDLPRMIARFYSAIGDVDRLRTVFDDYLTHCEELFAHLPEDDQYTWLRNYRTEGQSEETEIVDFLLDLMAEPEIERAIRLTRVLAELAKTRPELVCRVTCERMGNSKPLIRNRLEVLIESLAAVCATTIAQHFDQTLPAFKEPRFRTRMSLIRVVSAMSAIEKLPERVTKEAKEAERCYSPLIAFPSRKYIYSEPSYEFFNFLTKAVHVDLRNQIATCSELLEISLNVIVSDFERKLRASGWNEESETERLKEDWWDKGRDGRVVQIIPRFQNKIDILLQEFVHHAVENGRHDASTLAALENVLRAGDPAFFMVLPRAKPKSIPALSVLDGASWVNELNITHKRKVDNISTVGWSTVYEERVQSQTEGHHPLFVSKVSVRSVLVSSPLVNDLSSLPSSRHWSDRIPLVCDSERLTLKESQRRLLEEAPVTDLDNEVLPLVSDHNNSVLFAGFKKMAFLHPTWLQYSNLNFNGVEIMSNSTCIARFENWQEGYEDEPYSRDLLSGGMRLTVRNSWIRDILKDNNRVLLTRTEEKRQWFKDFWKQEPSAESKQKTDACLVYTT